VNADLKSYLHFLKLEKNSSPNTIESYRRDLERFLSYLDDAGIGSPAGAGEETIGRFVKLLGELGLSARSVSRNVTAIKMFYRFLVAEKAVDVDPTGRLDLPKLSRPLPDVLDPGEVEAILSQPDVSAPLGVRDRAILETLYATGIRVSELVTLTQANVFPDEHFIRVTGKGSKERIVPIGRAALEWIGRLGRALPEREGDADLEDGRLDDRPDLHAEIGDREGSAPAHLPAFVRDPPPRRGGGPALRPGDARAREHLDHADLHPHRPGVPAGSPPDIPSPRLSDPEPPPARPRSRSMHPQR
jgi:integrase